MPSPLPPREAGFAGTPGAGEGRVGAERTGSHLRVDEVVPGSAGAIVGAMGGEGGLVAPRLERGCRCFVGLLAGEVVAYGWVSAGAEWIGELGLEIRPPAGEAYVWNCVTLPGHRSRGYFGELLLQVVETSYAEGIPRVWIGSVDSMAEAAVVGAGFRPVLHFRVTDLLGLRWLSARPAEGAAPKTVAEALASLGSGRDPLRPGLRRVVHRTH